MEYTVNIPVWHIFHITAESEEEAMEKAEMELLPHDIFAIEDMSIEVNEEAK